MRPPKSVSVLGCGWLGFPLATHLISKGLSVKGSSTDPKKFPLFLSENIKPFLIRVNQEKIEGEDLELFFQSDCLFLNLPFKRDFDHPEIYFQQIKRVAEQAEQSSVSWVIFTSSTSIYPDDLSDAVEGAVFAPNNPRSKVLFEIEKYLLNQKKFAVTILRLAGLYGGDRKIGAFLSGRKNISDPKQPVNLVHQDDCVEIIIRLIVQPPPSGEIFNICSDKHPTKRELYTSAAQRLKLPLPEFNDSVGARNYKIVSNDKIKKSLEYQFKHPNPA